MRNRMTVGFVAALAASGASQADLVASVHKPAVDVRGRPALDAPALETLSHGATVTIAAQQGLWYELWRSPAAGYVRVNEVRLEPTAASDGSDNLGVVAQMEQEHRDLDARLNEFKALTRCAISADIAPLVREKGVALVKEFLHHMFLEEEVGFTLAEERLGQTYLEEAADRVLLLKEAEKGLEEPAAVD